MNSHFPPAEFQRICPIFLAGGIGSRLQPLSSPERPKQFIPLRDGQTLFEKTLNRFLDHPLHFSRGIVVANLQFQNYLASFENHLLGLLQEPPGKNTAAACLIGALAAQKLSQSEYLCFIPCDHMITNTHHFADDFVTLQLALKDGIFGLFGIPPKSPSADMGYIQTDKLNKQNHVYSVVRFIEKPTKRVAQKLLLKEDSYWNSGIILARKSDFLAAFKTHNQAFFDSVLAIWHTHARNSPKYISFNEAEYKKLPSQPVDKALLEKLEKILMLEAHFDWSDVGSKDAITPYLSDIDLRLLGQQRTTAPNAIIHNTF